MTMSDEGIGDQRPAVSGLLNGQRPSGPDGPGKHPAAARGSPQVLCLVVPCHLRHVGRRIAAARHPRDRTPDRDRAKRLP